MIAPSGICAFSQVSMLVFSGLQPQQRGGGGDKGEANFRVGGEFESSHQQQENSRVSNPAEKKIHEIPEECKKFLLDVFGKFFAKKNGLVGELAGRPTFLVDQIPTWEDIFFISHFLEIRHVFARPKKTKARETSSGVAASVGALLRRWWVRIGLQNAVVQATKGGGDNQSRGTNFRLTGQTATGRQCA